MKKGDHVQLKYSWGTLPTENNTYPIVRVAKDQAWADIETPTGVIRINAEDFKVVNKVYTGKELMWKYVILGALFGIIIGRLIGLWI